MVSAWSRLSAGFLGRLNDSLNILMELRPIAG